MRLETRYHLLRDFFVYKQTLKRNFYDNDRPADLNDVRDLLDRRTQWYTLAELERLFGFLWTASDDCVIENAHEYNPLQVHIARHKIEFGQSVIEKLRTMQSERLNHTA